MTHVIAEPCVGTKDTACVDVCPVDCIHPKSDEEAFEAVVERTTKKGATVYQVTLCPETAPFTTRMAADEFMRPRLRPPYYHERGRVDGVTRISRRCRSTQAEKPTKRPSKESSARSRRREKVYARPS